MTKWLRDFESSCVYEIGDVIMVLDMLGIKMRLTIWETQMWLEKTIGTLVLHHIPSIGGLQCVLTSILHFKRLSPRMVIIGKKEVT